MDRGRFKGFPVRAGWNIKSMDKSDDETKWFQNSTPFGDKAIIDNSCFFQMQL